MKLDFPFGREPRRSVELASLMVAPVEVTRSVSIDGRRRTLRLESDIWDSFREIAGAEGRSVDELGARIAGGLADGMSLATGVRVFVLNYFMRRAEPAAPSELTN